MATHLKPGLTVINLPLRAHGWQSVLFDFLSFLRVRGTVESTLVLGVSAGLLMPLMRLLSRGRRIVLNVDGLETQRAKWRGLKQIFLSLSERTAVAAADAIVSDNQGIAEVVNARYARRSTTIAYGHDHVVHLAPEIAATLVDRHFHLVPDTYCLSIARIEPENHIREMIEGFLGSSRPTYAVVGNFDASAYGRAVKHRFSGNPRVRLIDATYDKELLSALRAGCAVYLHGHSVGGTNPSLVEMLPYSRPIIAFDCTFNRHTLRDGCGYFRKPSDLASLLDARDASVFIPDRDLAMAPDYHWAHIATLYSRLVSAQ